MQFIQLLFTAIVAGTTMVSASASFDAALSPRAGVESHAHIRHHARSAKMIKKRKTCKAKSKKASKGTNSITTGGTFNFNDTLAGAKGLVAPPAGQKHKLGASWTYGNYMPIQSYLAKNSFYYTWDEGDHGLAADGYLFFPMLWSGSGDRVAKFKTAINDKLAQGQNPVPSKTVMLFNEPDIAGQANMSPQDACRVAREVILPLKQNHGFKIIGPAPANAMGDWYPNFVKACPDVEKAIDYSALHFYETNADQAISKTKKWFSTYNKPVYITETSCWSYYLPGTPQCTGEGQAKEYLSKFAKWCEDTEWCYGFAPFGFLKGQLPGDVGQFNTLSQDNGQPTSLFQTAKAAMAA